MKIVAGGKASKMSSSMFMLAVICTLALLTGCEDNKVSQIEWQLPLEAPEDLHGAMQDLLVPDWAAATPGDAEFVLLQKNTTHMFPIRLALRGSVEVQGWNIELLGLAAGLRIKNNTFLNDENVDNPAAFVAISRDGKAVYTGWLYAKFPELFGLDDPEWKVWLKAITLRPALEEEKQGSLSSAG